MRCAISYPLIRRADQEQQHYGVQMLDGAIHCIGQRGGGGGGGGSLLISNHTGKANISKLFDLLIGHLKSGIDMSSRAPTIDAHGEG